MTDKDWELLAWADKQAKAWGFDGLGHMAKEPHHNPWAFRMVAMERDIRYFVAGRRHERYDAGLLLGLHLCLFARRDGEIVSSVALRVPAVHSVEQRHIVEDVERFARGQAMGHDYPQFILLYRSRRRLFGPLPEAPT